MIMQNTRFRFIGFLLLAAFALACTDRFCIGPENTNATAAADSIRAASHDSIRATVTDSIYAAINDSLIHAALHDSIRAAVTDSINAAINDSLGPSSKEGPGGGNRRAPETISPTQ